MLVQRSSQALIDYHTMLFAPHFIHQIKHARERERERERERGSRYDYKSTKYYQAFFLWKENKISLVNIKLLLVQYLYFYYIFWKLLQPAKFPQCLITPVLVSYKLISYLKENIKLWTPCREQQKAPLFFLLRMHITPVA